MTYAIRTVSLNSTTRSLQVVFDKDVEEWMQGVRLEVKDNTTSRYKTFHFAGNLSGDTVDISTTGLNWFAGEAVELRLLIPANPPTAMQLSVDDAKPAGGAKGR